MRKCIGTFDAQPPRTPTLREYLKANPNPLPKLCFVERIFLPNRFPNVTFIAEQGFRVSLRLGDSDMETLLKSLSSAADDGYALFIAPDEDSPALFNLLIESAFAAEWETFDWGYTLKSVPAQPTPQNSRSASGKKSAKQLDIEGIG